MTTTHEPARDETTVDALPAGTHGRRRWPFLLVAIAAVVAAIALWVAGSDDEAGVSTTPTTATSTTVGPPSTTLVPSDPTVMWPAPGAPSFATAEAAGYSFATAFLGFEDPVLEPFQAGDVRSGEMPLRATADGAVTTLLLRQVGSSDGWSVLGAVSANIDVTSPVAGAAISSPVRVEGQALAFEGTVRVEVREDGRADPIGTGFVTGGGDVLRPFSGSISFETPSASYGSLVFISDSAENGQVWEAAAMRIAFAPSNSDEVACGRGDAVRPSPGPDQMVVTLYFTCDTDGALHPVHRVTETSTGVLRAALDALLGGPTDAERDGSFSSWFSAVTAGMLRSVNITDGHAVVDFGDLRSVIPNASASAGSELLLSQLDATVFQFATVTSVEYRIQGSCTEFNEWLQFGGCDPRTRPGAD